MRALLGKDVHAPTYRGASFVFRIESSFWGRHFKPWMSLSEF